MLIGLDLGGTKLLAFLVRPDGSVAARNEKSTAGIDGGDALAALLAEAVDELAAQSETRPEAVGVGAPGPLNSETGVIHTTPNIANIRSFPLARSLAERCGLPVFLENDANAALAGEQAYGAARGARDAIMLTLGTGVGGGVIASGQLVRGASGAAGELGHIIVERDGPRCGCGRRGCLEAIASGPNLLQRAREAGMSAEHPRELIAAARQGEAGARALLDRAGAGIGLALGILVCVLNPSICVIGGGLGMAAWPLLREAAEEGLRQACFAVGAEALELRSAALGNDAGALGAAHLAGLRAGEASG